MQEEGMFFFRAFKKCLNALLRCTTELGRAFSVWSSQVDAGRCNREGLTGCDNPEEGEVMLG